MWQHVQVAQVLEQALEGEAHHGDAAAAGRARHRQAAQWQHHGERQLRPCSLHDARSPVRQKAARSHWRAQSYWRGQESTRFFVALLYVVFVRFVVIDVFKSE